VMWHASLADAQHADAAAAVAPPLSVPPTPSQAVLTLPPAAREVLPSDMRNFYVISLVYLLFTITDTALRVSILLHVNNLGFSAFEISLMFCSYELCGVFTNFAGGLLATQIGLKYMLLGGVACQICSVCLLVPFRNSAVFDVFPTLAGRIAYIAFTQCFSGIAKDMIKLSGKSVSKLVLNKEEQSTLFRLVTNITGAKNAVKGAGFFLGTLLLQFTSFQPTLLILLALLAVLVPFICLQLGTAIGRSGSRIQWRDVLSKTREFNLLCMARLFLFGSRDIWFEVVLPIYFRNQLRWQSIAVGSFLAGWIIVYGGVQSNTDRLALKPLGCRPPTTRHLWPWACALVVTSAVVALAFTLTLPGQSIATATAIVVSGLTAYAIVFAVNSSVHSYLVVLLSDHDKVAQDVGFYYMSNALGRLVGILLGGVLYSFYAMASESKTEDDARSESFAACLWGSCVLIALSTVFAWSITSSVVTSSSSRTPPVPTDAELQQLSTTDSRCGCCEDEGEGTARVAPSGEACHKSCPACCHLYDHPNCAVSCTRRHAAANGTIQHTHS